MTLDGRIGIDIEKNTPIKKEFFKKWMTEDEWEAIDKAYCRNREFYKYWTIKESVLKADGRGLYAPLDAIRIEKDTAILGGNIWNLREIFIDPDYICHLAADTRDFPMKLEEIGFY
jgi:4'-phosphopantetheinyl transferase